MHRSSLFAAIIVMQMFGGVTSALADCRKDHIAADQNVRRTRVGIEKLADGTEAAKCAAYRRHIAALTEQRGMMARCDTGPNQAQNVSSIDTIIADFNKRAEVSCKR
ncbi:MAG: hypothetical protein ACRC9K_10795 [Afipia sp.]